MFIARPDAIFVTLYFVSNLLRSNIFANSTVSVALLVIDLNVCWVPDLCLLSVYLPVSLVSVSNRETSI